MAKTLSLFDLLKLQFSTLEQLDRDTLLRLEPVLVKSYNQLRSELDKFASDSFSYSQKRQTLRAIDRSLAKIYNENIGEMEYFAKDFNDFAHEMSNIEVKNMQKQVGLYAPNVKKDVISLKQNEFLLNEMKASVLGHSVDLRRKVSHGLTEAVIQRKSGYEATVEIGKKVNLEKWKIQRIVRTEMSKIFNRTKLLSYNEFNEKNFKGRMLKRMFHPMDNRTAEDSKQWAHADPAIPLDAPFRMVIKRKLKSGAVRNILQEGMTPPLRPNDRATLMSFLPEWKE